MDRIKPDLINTPEGLRPLLEDLEAAPAVGVDSEMDSYYSYAGKICLVQFSTERADWLVDPLRVDLGALGPVFEDPSRVVIFHAGENDIPYFRRQCGLSFARLFDTYLAARVLGYPQCGLAGLLEQHFGVSLDKRFQMADWRIRPLPADMAEYARMDTRYLLRLREILQGQLEEAGRVVEAESEFQRATQVTAVEKTFDPEGWVRMKGARKMPAQANGMLRALYNWREAEACRRDVPPFRVLPDSVILALASTPPESVEELRRGYRHPTVQGSAPALLASLREGQSLGRVAAPRPRRNDGEMLTPEQEKVYRHLREWRNRRSAERGVEPDRISPNRLLKQIVLASPATAEELAGVPGLEPWRLQEYGAEILEHLAPGS